MSPLEQHVTTAVGRAQPDAAVDFGVILQIMSTVLQFIQQCPFGNARRAIRDGALEAKVAAYRAVKASGFGGNAVDLTNALIEQGRQATDAELDATIASAHALPSSVWRAAGAGLALWLAIGTAATAGPFPERGPASAGTGPFPLDVADAGARQALAGMPAAVIGAEFDDPVSHRDPLNPKSRILNPPQPSLREQIDAYRAQGGGIVGVRGMSITAHMLRDHGWTASQLSGLTADELYLLHGMQHAGQIDPRHAVAASGGDSSVEPGGHPVRMSGRTAYWTVAGVQWSNLGGGVPREGQVHRGGGRAFIYRDGRMHVADGAASPSGGERCPGGRCRLR